MAKVICIANHKGGVGKTTSTAHIAKALSSLGKQVLMIDLDAQANLTAIFMKGVPGLTISESLINDNKPLAEAIVDVDENLHLIPASLELARADYYLISRMSREHILRKLLNPVKDAYDYILLDCPPALSLITTNAFVATDEIFIPLMAEALPMFGLKMIQQVINDVKDINPNLAISAVFFNRFHNRKLDHSILEAVNEQFGDIVMDTKIRENVAAAEAPLSNQTTFDYAPNSNAAKDYADLVTELIKKGKL